SPHYKPILLWLTSKLKLSFLRCGLKSSLQTNLIMVDEQVKIVGIDHITAKPGNKYIFQGEEEEV
ncbi:MULTISPECIES: hypothetical protein, partial [unclassified Microcoleus]|uniref:hypothetical protein n=1 Tax=unclassified Microcoleus TaxID=2642155 RepID=UPI0025DE1BDA